MSENMLALNEFVTGALVTALVGVAVLTVVRVFARIRASRPHRAGKRFMARYRAAHPVIRKASVKAPVPLGRLVVRSRTPSNVGEPR
jgi:hypothetical protein